MDCDLNSEMCQTAMAVLDANYDYNTKLYTIILFFIMSGIALYLIKFEKEDYAIIKGMKAFWKMLGYTYIIFSPLIILMVFYRAFKSYNVLTLVAQFYAVLFVMFSVVFLIYWVSVITNILPRGQVNFRNKRE